MRLRRAVRPGSLSTQLSWASLSSRFPFLPAKPFSSTTIPYFLDFLCFSTPPTLGCPSTTSFLSVFPSCPLFSLHEFRFVLLYLLFLFFISLFLQWYTLCLTILNTISSSRSWVCLSPLLVLAFAGLYLPHPCTSQNTYFTDIHDGRRASVRTCLARSLLSRTLGCLAVCARLPFHKLDSGRCTERPVLFRFSYTRLDQRRSC